MLSIFIKKKSRIIFSNNKKIGINMENRNANILLIDCVRKGNTIILKY